MKNIIRLFELLLIISLVVYIVFNWNNPKITVGHFFSLELLAMLFWYEYDNFKNNGK